MKKTINFLLKIILSIKSLAFQKYKTNIGYRWQHLLVQVPSMFVIYVYVRVSHTLDTYIYFGTTCVYLFLILLKKKK